MRFIHIFGKYLLNNFKNIKLDFAKIRLCCLVLHGKLPKLEHVSFTFSKILYIAVLNKKCEWSQHNYDQ